MKKYRITCSTDAYHASRCKRYEGCQVLKYDGATPVKWVHDNNYYKGYALDEARRVLMRYAHEDNDQYAIPVHHKFFSMSYESDVFTYKAEEI